MNKKLKLNKKNNNRNITSNNLDNKTSQILKDKRG